MGARVRCWVLLLALGLGAAAVQADEVPVARFAGRVVDAEGRPVAGARLWLQVLRVNGNYAFLARNLGTADDDGRFAAEVPQTGFSYDGVTPRPWPKRWRYLVAAWEPDHGLGWARADPDTEAEVRMTRAAVLRGRVLDADGAPLADVPVRLRHLSILRGPEEPNTLSLEWPEPRPLWALTRTDAEGRFEFTGLPVDALAEASVQSPGRRGMEWGDQWVPDLSEVKLAEQTNELTVQLVRTPTIAGQLLLPDGRGTPATHVFVKALGRTSADPRASGRIYRASVDEQGRYRFTGLQPGSYTIWVDNADYTGVIGRGLPLTRDQQLELPPMVLEQSGRVEGRVLDADTGEPIARAGTTAQRSDVPRWGWPWGQDGAVCDAEGRYRLRVAPAETRIYVISACGYDPRGYAVTWTGVGNAARARIAVDEEKPSSRTVHPKPGEVITGVDLYLKRGAEVAGKVIGPDGNPWPGHIANGFPLPGSQVDAIPDPAWVVGFRPTLFGAFIGPQGEFLARGLYPGLPVVLTVFDRDLEVGGAVRVTPEANQRKEVVIRLGPAARVRGRVLMPDGQPAVGVAVGIGGRYGRTDADGRFDLLGGVPGELCAVSANALPGTDQKQRLHGESKTVEIAPGQQVVDVGDIVLAPEKQ